MALPYIDRRPLTYLVSPFPDVTLKKNNPWSFFAIPQPPCEDFPSPWNCPGPLCTGREIRQRATTPAVLQHPHQRLALRNRLLVRGQGRQVGKFSVSIYPTNNPLGTGSVKGYITVLIFPLFHSLDDTSEHFLLHLVPSLLLIGTICVFWTSSGGIPCYSMSHFAILKDYHQHGFGCELVQMLHKWVIADSQSQGEQIAMVLCYSLVMLKSFYAR